MGFLAGNAEQLEKGQNWNGNGYHGGKSGKDGGKNQWQQESGTIGSEGQVSTSLSGSSIKCRAIFSVRSPGSLRCVERQRVASPSRITCMELLTSPTFNGILRSNSLTNEDSEKIGVSCSELFPAPPGLVFRELVGRMSTLDCWYGYLEELFLCFSVVGLCCLV